MNPLPNIVFIMADDLGWGDLSCYGRPDYATPVLDRLAGDGMRLTHAYANSSTCSPTRVALLTGRYQHRLRVGLEEPILPGCPHGVPAEQPTLPGLLRQQGYETALVGKWHLGWAPDYGPLKSGYDEFFGAMGGELDYFRHTTTTALGAGETDGLYDGEEIVQRTGYTTDLFTDRAIEVLERPRQAPLFLSLHYTAPHWPWEGPNDIEESRRLRNLVHYDGGSLSVFADMVRHLDQSVGRVLDTLDRLGMADNTLVIFTSDNGGERFSYMWPFIGEKGDLFEGGLRVPAIVRWPSQVPAGALDATPCMSMDWLPTLLQAAGVDVAQGGVASDGISLLPALRGEGRVDDRALFWRTREQGALRLGEWKYLVDGQLEFLFNVVQDPREQANCKLREPERLADMQQRYAQWESEMLPYPEREWPGIRVMKDRFRNLD